jgi:hypothetical protein
MSSNPALKRIDLFIQSEQINKSSLEPKRPIGPFFYFLLVAFTKKFIEGFINELCNE